MLHPPAPLQAWLQGRPVAADEDLHSRAAALSQVAFYGVIEAFRARQGTPGVYLGLRQEESRGRRWNRTTRGLVYRARGEPVCQPIADWEGIDVYAYLATHGVDLLPLYHCVRLHPRPDLVRKAWWVPGGHTCRGGTVWLRTYWPSLYQRLCALLPDARGHA